MKCLTMSAVALSLLGFASTSAQAQTKLFFYGDLERGNQPGIPPACVLNNQFKHLEKVVWRLRIHDQTGQELNIPFTAGKGKYLYLHVKEQGGKDNPVGDGDDLDGDGKRDDLNDSAWTSPVWFDLVQVATFVWSKNSDKYHEPNCWAVKNIGAANRREGPAPEGKTKHDCHPQ